jgi:ATP-dependent helicase HrpB
MVTTQSQITLPIDAHLDSIAQAMREQSNVIIVAEPGAGKTTRVPVALMKATSKTNPEGRWIVLQPRRWAAKLTATRIADENRWKIGEEVGYQVRFETKVSKNSRLVVMTEGVLLRKLAQDPELNGIAGVILDEFHERSLDLDLALSILKEVQESFRPDLKIIVMSATLDPAPIEKFLGPGKTFLITGRVFPVHKRYLGAATVLSAVKTALREIADKDHFDEGDFLVFLPGAYEIDKNAREIYEFLREERLDREILVLPLYSSLPDAEQKKVFTDQFSANGKRLRKIILSTNIAETSLTLPNVKVVIDSGWAKVMRTDPQAGQDRLETLRISRASSEQRAGRAGRVSEGICYRLWTEGEQSQLRHFETPEIHRVNLSHALLFLSEFGVKDFEKFSWFDAPKSSLLRYSIQELLQLDFIREGVITESGKKALALPLSPRLAKLVIEAEKAKVKPFAARLAAFLENRSDRSSDGAIQSEEQLVSALGRLNGAALQSAKQIQNANDHSLPEVYFSDWDLYELVLLRSMRTQVFIQERLVGRRKVQARDGSKALPRAGLILSSQERTQQGVPVILIQSFVPLSPAAIEKEAKKKKRVFWDEELKRVRCLEGLFFEDLELGTVTEVAVLAEDAERILTDLILKNPLAIFSQNEEFQAWYQRVEFYRRHRAENDLELNWDWEEVIQAAVSGKTRLEQVVTFSVPEYLEGVLDRGLISKWNHEVPEKIEMPTGSKIKIDYSGDQPKLAVRLQEIFGWLETPRIMGNRLPIVTELLSPGFKPIQVTQDLKSFWKSAYFEVKKELKARYPKHSWPEDPLTAKPEAKGRRRF